VRFVLLQDLGDVERRAQAAEIRHQELSAKLPEATTPLLRQISSLQDASSAQVTSQLLAAGKVATFCATLLLTRLVAVWLLQA
jgi:hypothetical protein